MELEPPNLRADHPEFARLVQLVSSGRYFRRLSPEILANVLKHGEVVYLEKDSYLIQQGDDAAPRLYILVEGSLAVVTNGAFILRLDQPGDVVGEMAVIQSVPRSADVVAEVDSRLIVFPEDLFKVTPSSSEASILYVLFSHILAEKLRVTTAQSLIRKNRRVAAPGEVHVAIIDVNPDDREMVRQAVDYGWSGAKVVEFHDPTGIADYTNARNFDLVFIDIDFSGDIRRDWAWATALLTDTRIRSAHIVILSKSCHDTGQRERLIKLGVDDLLAKPCSRSDLGHIIARVQTWHYKNLELDKAESEAETDGLTGLANRRRLDQFLDALVTVYPDDKKPFSLIITDIDNFKHYNDANGHQMGDTVLRKVATMMRERIRRSDLAARFGGEEFILVLPDCGKERAMEVAEKLRAVVEEADFPMQESQPNGSLTTTLGVATFPDDAHDLEVLLKKADDCLYEGKRMGKNRVVPAQPFGNGVSRT